MDFCEELKEKLEAERKKSEEYEHRFYGYQL